ncbi:hypothetical protein S40293_10521 [Stachybotrys chartarum IBT 40293]|nr:hypothetical protein S40293_10521 [Stachybotrys chartarum IBT 40293]
MNNLYAVACLGVPTTLLFTKYADLRYWRPKALRHCLARLVPIDVATPDGTKSHIDSQRTYRLVRDAVQARIAEQVNDRLKEEDQGAKVHGDPIWFSQRFDDLGQMEWSIIVRGKQYGLLQIPGPRENHVETNTLAVSATKESYSALLHHYIVPQRVEAERWSAGALRPYEYPLASRHIMTLVGWTTRRDCRLERACEKCSMPMPATRRNYRKFFLHFASLIVAHKATDWDWLVVSACSRPEWKRIALQGVPGVIALTWLRRLERLRASSGEEPTPYLNENIETMRTYSVEKQYEYITHIIMRTKTNTAGTNRLVQPPLSETDVSIRMSAAREFRMAYTQAFDRRGLEMYNYGFTGDLDGEAIEWAEDGA